MATKISAAQLKGIMGGGFQTGGTGNTSPGTNNPAPGVADYTSNLAKVKDPRDVLNVAKSTRKRVMALSPFIMEDLTQASKMERYARRVVTDSTNKNEAVMLMSLFFYSNIAYTSPIERDMALHSAISWVPGIELLAVYIDYGITPAMQVVINVAETKGKKIEYRSIGGGA